ncbi:MAG: hypothetical protein JXR69_03245 [Candidatus Delongbacteria bacterium]|nr:hypothetical protein [Candidatus Delongbacteria bacterium]
MNKEPGWRPNGEWKRFALLESNARELNKNEIYAGISAEVKSEFENNNSSSNKFADSFGPGMDKLLNDLGNSAEGNFGNKYQLYHLGISVMRVPGQKYDLFKKLLFVSSRELTNLLSNIEELLDNYEKKDLYNFMYTYTNLCYGEKEIKDLTNQEFRDIMNNVIKKYEELNRIVNDNNYKYSFEVADARYYWISEDLFP